MTRIAPVRMKMNPRTYWFDARDFELEKGQKIVVSTVRGVELGVVAEPVFEADEQQIGSLKSPLKPIVRVATDEDVDRAQEMEKLSAEALPIFRNLVEESQLDMRPVSVEYLLDGDKAVFYFESEERIDFRDLVRKLAAHFHVRVDMRQIGVRDEARMIGGLGHCGQELCCARMGGDFNPVSIRMAKEQDLSLNPQKISGTCGRLMCCLRYEYDAYKDFNARAPKKNASISTPEGPAKVTSLDVPREIVTIKLEGESEKTVKVPLDAFDVPEKEAGKDRVRPSTIGQEAWDEALSQEDVRAAFDSIFQTSQFTKSDKVGDAKAVYNERKQKEQGDKKHGRSRRSRSKQGQGQPASVSQSAPERKHRRRSTKITSNSTSDARSVQKSEEASPKSVRPGQKSSGLRSSQTASSKPAGDGSTSSRSSNRRRSSKRKNVASSDASKTQGAMRDAKQGAPAENASRPSNQASGGEHRRSRRRSHKSGGAAAAPDSSKE